MTEKQRTRSYVSPRRARQAQQTRAEIVAAATDLFVSLGWRGTTIAAVAARAGVVVDTIYAGFGSKAGLLAAAKDAARDAEEAARPYFERTAFRSALSEDADRKLAQVAELLATVNARTWRLDAVWRDAAASEPSISKQAEQRELDRRTQIEQGLHLLLPDPVSPEIVNTVWILTGSEVYAKLLNTAGFTHQQYIHWLMITLGQLLDDPGRLPTT